MKTAGIVFFLILLTAPVLHSGRPLNRRLLRI